jgi:hypothetical protein
VRSAAFQRPILNDAMFESFYPCYLYTREGIVLVAMEAHQRFVRIVQHSLVSEGPDLPRTAERVQRGGEGEQAGLVRPGVPEVSC